MLGWTKRRTVGKGSIEEVVKRLVTNTSVEFKLSDAAAAELLIRKLRDYQKTLPPKPGLFTRGT